MKKLLCVVFASMVLVGCGGKGEKKTTSCVFSTDLGGVNTEMKVEFDSEGELVKKQNQTTTIKVKDEKTYEAAVNKFKSMGYAEVYKNVEGTTYKVTEDKANKKIVENITIDLDKVSGDNYALITNGQSESTGDKAKMALSKSIENFESQGFTCKTK